MHLSHLITSLPNLHPIISPLSFLIKRKGFLGPLPQALSMCLRMFLIVFPVVVFAPVCLESVERVTTYLPTRSVVITGTQLTVAFNVIITVVPVKKHWRWDQDPSFQANPDIAWTHHLTAVVTLDHHFGPPFILNHKICRFLSRCFLLFRQLPCSYLSN